MGERWSEQTLQLEIPDIKAFKPEVSEERKRQMENARWKTLAFKQAWNIQSIIDSQLANTDLQANLNNIFVTWALENTVKSNNIEKAFAAQDTSSLTKTSVDSTVKDVINKMNNEVGAKAENPNQLKNLWNDVWNMITRLSPELWKLIESILGFFGIKGFKLWNKESSTETDKELKKLKNEEEQKKILKSYGVEVDTPIKGTNMLKFLPKSTVSCIKTPIPTDPIDTKIQPKTIPNALDKDGKLPINYEQANSLDIKETENGLIITVNNKNGSIFTYTVISEKKPTGSPKP